MGELAVIFDTLQYAKRAEEVGFTKAQAEFQAEETAKIIQDHIATKEDINNLRDETKKDMNEIRFSMKEMENRLITKMGVMSLTVLTLTVSILTMVIKL